MSALHEFHEDGYPNRKPTDLTVSERRWLRCHIGGFEVHGNGSIGLRFMTRKRV